MNRMKSIFQNMICIATILLSINLATAVTTITFPTATTTSYASNNTLGCFQANSGGLNSIPCIIGAGFSSLFGSVFLNIFVLIIMIVLCAKLRLPLDLSAVAIFTFVVITNIAITPSLIYYGLLLIILIVVGYGAFKFWHRG